MIANTTKKIAKVLNEYKSTLDANSQEQYFTASDVIDLNSSFWINTDHDYVRDIPATVQRQLIDQHQLLERAREEKQLVISDLIKMISTLESELLKTNNRIVQLLDNVSLDPTREDMITSIGSTDHLCLFDKGKLSAVMNHSQQIVLRLCRARDTLSHLSRAYWNEDGLQKKHLKSAARHGQAPLLPPIFMWNDTVEVSDYPVNTTVDMSDSETNSSTSSCSTACSSTDTSTDSELDYDFNV